jgi:cation transport regulator ChaC
VNASLFAYGTLMFPGVVRRLAGRTLATRPATLPGYSRRALRRASYPGLVPEPGARVETARGDAALAHVYALAPRSLTRALESDWDAAAFERDHLARWLRNAARFTAREIDA